MKLIAAVILLTLSSSTATANVECRVTTTTVSAVDGKCHQYSIDDKSARFWLAEKNGDGQGVLVTDSAAVRPFFVSFDVVHFPRKEQGSNEYVHKSKTVAKFSGDHVEVDFSDSRGGVESGCTAPRMRVECKGSTTIGKNP